MATAYFGLKIIRRNRLRRQKKEAEKLNKTPQLPRICRICLNEGTISIYGGDSAPDISESIRIFGEIDIDVDDDYPKYLCQACNSLLQNAVLFRHTAKKSDIFLRENQQNVELSNEYVNNVEFSENDNSNDDESYEIGTSKSYTCKLCTLSFQSNNEYIAHKNSKRHKNVRIQCPICYGLLTPQLYKRHLARHESASHLICEVCGKMYRKDNLLRHLQLHSFELPYECQVCPYRGRYIDSLKIHMRSHTGDKPFCCDKCQLRFLTRSNLNRHLLTHRKDRPFKCNECGRGFYTKRDLDAHFKSDHAGIKEFGCHLCGNKYGTRKALMRHELRVHKRDKMVKGRMPLYLQAEYQRDVIES
ncbi:gastrula zinc finger protein XlCGF17.1-like [Pectinophora gossypiella]|uniref:gastrula zinc finger protein XlCGF17.1-like n=1 Tax=Pectinophora gossypiella TaxID=13191 RepID=UPI00214F1AFE|nr:gastrula zinc finger protein XlCGF17.1-like [Pectinophora gossypiella]